MSWHKYSWMAEFMRQIPNYRSNTVDTVRLAIAARELLLEHAKTYDFDFNPVHDGILHFYSEQADYDHAAKVNELYLEGGLDRRPVTREEMREIDPSLTGEYIGGFFTPSDFTGDIHRYTVGLATGIEKEGVSCKHGDGGNVVKLVHHGKALTGPRGYDY